ncbi:MAG: Hpt domain-containing protein, partial [Psychrobacter sp.]
MKNQPNDIVTFQWLLPLFNQQLTQISDGWQLGESSIDHEQLISSYHQISGALIMLKLPLLAGAASKLSQLAGLQSCDDFSIKEQRIGQFSHRLLQREINQYARTGIYHIGLINRAVDELTQALSQRDIETDIPVKISDIEHEYTNDHANNENIINSIEVAMPTEQATASLTSEQCQQLLLVWRQQVQALLITNTNQSSALSTLEKASQYLRQTAQDSGLQRLWCLTELLLSDLAHNETPLPERYAPLLGQLDQVIESCAQSNEVPSTIVVRLTTAIYVELSYLAHSSKRTQSILDKVSQSTTTASRFLPQLLTQLDALIFKLDDPDSLVAPLQHIKEQLKNRGWTYYVSQVESILADLKQSLVSETSFAQEQWQIERKLQELYNAIYSTEQTISLKIGDATSFATLPEVMNSNETELTGKHDPIPTDDGLRELRIAVEEIKQNFNDYIQHQDIGLLPASTDFTSIGQAFDDMELPEIRHTMDDIGSLFAQLTTRNITTPSWSLVQALAESLTSIELLLDYLAQQVFDQQLLNLANEHTARATQLLDTDIESPATLNETVFAQESAATNVVRYDDSGEINPVINIDDANIVEQDKLSLSNNTESDALKQAREHVKPDNFETDEDVHDIFIEEVTEIITDLEDFLPIWAQDSQDLTPLTEVRRGFHTLKGSGRMVGAFSISEIAWSIENLLNRLLDKTLPVTDDVVNLVVDTTKILPALVADFSAQRPPSFDPAITILQSSNLMSRQPVNTGLTLTELAPKEVMSDDAELEKSLLEIDDVDNDSNNDSTELVTDSNNKEVNINEYLSTLDIPESLAPFIRETNQLPADADDADPDIKEIFIEEANEVLAEIVPLYESWQ